MLKFINKLCFPRDGNILHTFREKLRNFFPDEYLSNIEYDQNASEQLESDTVTVKFYFKQRRLRDILVLNYVHGDLKFLKL